jgi:nitrite reductase/ring-hydroxylating ferredoxin subunit
MPDPTLSASPRFPFAPFPHGWYALCFSHELGAARVRRRVFMGRELVLFRGASGRVGVLAAHCPHMGAHLAHGGRVEGDALRCPMHGFAFDASGACVATGYGTRPSPKCRANAYPVLEQNGIVLGYHGSDSPAWQPPAEDMSGFAALRTHVVRDLASHPQETTENSVDIGHLAVVHGYEAVEVSNALRTEGHHLTISYRVQRRSLLPGTPAIDATFTIDAYGLGYSFVDVRVPSHRLRTRHFVLCTPTDGEHVDLHLAGTLRGEDGLGRVPAALIDRLIGALVFRGFLSDVRQDLPIWSNKVYVQPPALAEGDGPIGKYRGWARQFYVDGGHGQAQRPDVVVAALNTRD